MKGKHFFWKLSRSVAFLTAIFCSPLIVFFSRGFLLLYFFLYLHLLISYSCLSFHSHAISSERTIHHLVSSPFVLPPIVPISSLPSFSHQERPKSALERLSSPTEALQLPSSQSRGRMSAEEQLERMKRHQKALVRERKRNLSQGERSCTGLSTSTATTQRSSSSSRLPSSTSDPPASVRYPPPPRSSSRHREHHLPHHCCYATLQPPAT